MKSTLLKVYLQPKASKNEIVGPYRDGMKIRVTAPAIEGKANEALIQLLSKTLEIPKTSIQIIKGQHSREKTLTISGIKNGIDLLDSSKYLDFKGKID